MPSTFVEYKTFSLRYTIYLIVVASTAWQNVQMHRTTCDEGNEEWSTVNEKMGHINIDNYE